MCLIVEKVRNREQHRLSNTETLLTAMAPVQAVRCKVGKEDKSDYGLYNKIKVC